MTPHTQPTRTHAQQHTQPARTHSPPAHTATPHTHSQLAHKRTAARTHSQPAHTKAEVAWLVGEETEREGAIRKQGHACFMYSRCSWSLRAVSTAVSRCSFRLFLAASRASFSSARWAAPRSAAMVVCHVWYLVIGVRSDHSGCTADIIPLPQWGGRPRVSCAQGSECAPLQNYKRSCERDCSVTWGGVRDRACGGV